MNCSWAYRDVLRIHRQRHGERPLGDDERRVIVLAGGKGRRLAGDAASPTAVPKQFRSFGQGPTLLQRTLRRWSRYVPSSRFHVVIQRSDSARAAPQLRACRDAHVTHMPDDGGTAISCLVALIDILVDAPEAMVMVTPSDQIIDADRAYDDVLASALRCAYFEQEIANVTARGTPTSPAIIAPGRTLLHAFTQLAPRLVRLTLHCAETPAAEAATKFELAFSGLGALDLYDDLAPLFPRVRRHPLQSSVVDLDTPADVHRWRALSARMPLALPPLCPRRQAPRSNVADSHR